MGHFSNNCPSVDHPVYLTAFILFFKDFNYWFLERGREGEREGEKHQCVVASRAPPTEDLVHNPGMCPDWDSTGDPLVHRPALDLLSPTSQGIIAFIKTTIS